VTYPHPAPINAQQAEWLGELTPWLEPIPLGMRDAIVMWVLWGRPTGSFLQALLSNDLMGAFRHGDEHNQRTMRDWVKLLYNGAPAGCYGSPANVKAWAAQFGLADAEFVEARRAQQLRHDTTA